METVFACDVDTQDTHYVVYNNDENNAVRYNVFYSVCDAIWFIQNYTPIQL
jgi:hypothetical protein